MAPWLVFTAVFVLSSAVGLLLFDSAGTFRQRLEKAAGKVAGKRAESDMAPHRGKQAENTNRAALQTLRQRERTTRRVALIPLLSRKIQQAGYGFSPHVALLACGALFLLTVLFTLAQTGHVLLSVVLGVVIGFLLPTTYVNRVIVRRRVRFVRELPDALDLIVRGVKSGLPLNESMQAVATEIPGPVGEEFANVVEKLVVGVALEDVLDRMFRRMPLAEVNFMRIVFSIQHRSGGNISEALSNLSSVLRSRVMMKEKIGAITAEARASSVIVGALPFVMAALMAFSSPGYLNPLIETQTGQKALMIGFVLFLFGVMTLTRMSKVRQ